MTEEKKDNPPVTQDPRMPLPARGVASSRLPGGLDRVTIMMGLLFFVGMAWVLWESQAASPQSANANDSANAIMIKAGLMDMKLLTVGGKDQDDESGKLAATFYLNVKERQIPLAGLKINPFVTTGCEAYTEEKTSVLAEIKKEKVSDKSPVEIVAPPVDKMLLQSVLVMGGASSATISGVLITKGQIIGGWTVVEIHPTKVILQWRDRKYILEMSQ